MSQSDPRILLVQAVADTAMSIDPDLNHSQLASIFGLSRQYWGRARVNGAHLTSVVSWLELWAASGREPIVVAMGEKWARAWPASQAPKMPPEKP